MKKKITKKVLERREKRRIHSQEKKLWKMLREQIIKEQGGKCYLCQKTFLNDKLDLHHIIDRRIKALEYDKENLVALCSRCHRLSPLAVHNTAIYFAYVLEVKEPTRYYYLLSKMKELNINVWHT